MKEKRVSPLFIVLKWLLRLLYRKIEVVGAENLPEEPSVIVGNHTQMNGPIACELYFPGQHYTWSAGAMFRLKDVPAYAFQDFWSQKPKYTHWFYRILSYLIAPLAVLIFNNANTIEVHRDMRIVSTFKNTISCLEGGANVIIFPEQDKKYNNILYDFQEGFVDVARYYHRKTGREIDFVPLYIAPYLNKMYIGKPVRFDASAPIQQERRRICDEMMQAITDIARGQPKHTVVPYRNIPRKDYPCNIPDEGE